MKLLAPRVVDPVRLVDLNMLRSVECARTAGGDGVVMVGRRVGWC